MTHHRRLVVYEREDKLWDWKLVAGNNEVVASSLQGFTRQDDAVEAANREHPDLPIAIEASDG